MNEPAGDVVLVVEDDPEIRESIAELVEQGGLHAVALADGRAAAEYLDSAIVLPKLILLDLLMPQSDGWKFHELRAQDEVLREIPVVVMTGAQVSAADVPWAKEILIKPVSVEQLVATIDKYL